MQLLLKRGQRILVFSAVSKAESMKIRRSDNAERRKNWTPREPKIKTGYLARYASLVTSANRGAVLEIK